MFSLGRGPHYSTRAEDEGSRCRDLLKSRCNGETESTAWWNAFSSMWCESWFSEKITVLFQRACFFVVITIDDASAFRPITVSALPRCEEFNKPFNYLQIVDSAHEKKKPRCFRVTSLSLAHKHRSSLFRSFWIFHSPKGDFFPRYFEKYAQSITCCG